MSGPAHAPCEIDEPASPDDWERALLDRQLETLDRLAELGLAVASAIKDRVTAPEASDTVVQHAALDFARAARAVRMTLALQSKLVRDFKTPTKVAAAGAGGQGVDWLQLWPEPEPERQPSEKSRLRDAVRRAAEESGLEPEAVERLDAEARERLERDDMDRIMHRPFDEIVALICEELGLDHLPRLRGRWPEGTEGAFRRHARRKGVERHANAGHHPHTRPTAEAVADRPRSRAVGPAA